jgi:hypothetical protein
MAKQRPVATGYWKKRQRLIYYRYIDLIVRGVAADCRSMIDVGSRNTPLIERFNWIDERVALDIRPPYESENVRGIQADFLTFMPQKRFDIAMCCQVLEHIPDAGPFAQHLFEIADRVLITLPYLWPEGGTKGHVHDPVDLEKLIGWTKRKPDYHVLVEEPLCPGDKCRRLIAFYAKAGDRGWFAEAHKTMRKGGPRRARLAKA